MIQPSLRALRVFSRYSAPAALALLSACGSIGGGAFTQAKPAPGPAAQATGLAQQAERITDERIYADRQTLESVQQRLRKLNEGGIAQSNYGLAKAQCWLDTAKTQYHENDRTGYVEESLLESVKVVRELESNPKASAGLATPLVAKSTLLRQDLWDALSSHKSNAATLPCNARTVACAEVRLVRAGHAEQQTGWRQALPHVQMAEDGLRKAAIEAQACVDAPVAPKAVVIAAAPVPAPAPAPAPVVAPAPATDRETYVLLADALFVFDKHTQQDIIVGGAARIAEVADRLKRYKSIDTLAVVGHTDRFGSDAYNDKLSKDRAATVLQLLTAAGVKANTTSAEGKGKREPVTTTCAANLPRDKAIVCLQPDRRVTISITGVVR